MDPKTGLYKPQELKRLGLVKAKDAMDFLTGLKLTEEFYGRYFDPIWWQEKIIRDVYGTLKPTGYRQYKQVYLEVPKKQGKSGLISGIGLKGLAADGEFNAEVYTCAADKKQASIIFDTSVAMLDQLFEDEPELKPDFGLVISQKRIAYYPTKSIYQVMSSDHFSKHGYKPYYVLFDEIHAQPDRRLFDVMTFGSGDARKQPLFWYITTAGDDPERQSLGWDLHSYAESILLGNVKDPSWYPAIFGFDPETGRIWKGWDYEPADPEVDGKPEDQWKSRRIWSLVNPSYEHMGQAEAFEEAFTTASQSKDVEKLFKWLRLNIWLKYRSTKWIPQEKWDETAGLVVPEKLAGRECYAGIDLSSKIDLAAAAFLFPPIEGDPLWYVIFKFWIPEENMKERVKKDKVKYDEWVRHGFIKTTPGNSIDYATIEDDVLEFLKAHPLKELGFDPWNAYQMAQNLVEKGLPLEKILEVRQGFKDMSEPMKYLEGLIGDKKIRHGGNPVARWNFGNVDVLVDNHENKKPIKDKQGKNRIDGIVALINAMNRAILHENQKPSVYETRASFRL
jgi:phage terminase large subunit-like protein